MSSTGLPRPEYRILCELQVLELIADRIVVLVANHTVCICSRAMSMFSLVTALVSHHVVDEMRNHKGLLSELLHGQADVVCMQLTDAICLLQGDWQNIKHAYMVLEEFYYKVQAQNAIQSMLTPAHGGGDVNAYEVESPLDFRCDERLKRYVDCSVPEDSVADTSPADDQSISLDLSQSGVVNMTKVASIDGSQARHSSVDSADSDMKYSSPDENVVYLGDTSVNEDDPANVRASVTCQAKVDTSQSTRDREWKPPPLNTVVSTTTALDSSSIDTCSPSPMTTVSDNRANESIFIKGATTDESVQRVLANMPSLAGMFPQLLGSDDFVKSDELDPHSLASHVQTPMWNANYYSDIPFSPPQCGSITTGDGGKKRQCGMCATTLGSSAALQEHIISVHAGRNHCCLYCSETFLLYTDYVRHQKTHLAKYTCRVCTKVYRSDSRLREHIRTHDKDYVKIYHSCPKCARLFTHKYNMQVHLKTQHFGCQTNRRYFCKLCGDKFTKPTLLREHETSQHNASPKHHRCTLCGVILSSYSNMLTHRHTVHGESSNIRAKESSSQNNIAA